MELTQNGKLIRIERMQNDGRKKLCRHAGQRRRRASDFGFTGKMLFGVDRETFERTFFNTPDRYKIFGHGRLESALKIL